MILSLRSRRILLADWFARLAREAGLELSQFGTSGEALTLRSPHDFSVRAEFVDDEPYVRFIPSDSTNDDLIARVAGEASALVAAGELGGRVWYSTELHETVFNMATPQFMRSLVQRFRNPRILGWRRLGGEVLLEFVEVAPDGDTVGEGVAPNVVAKVHIAVPGPRAGLFASELAHGALEVVGAICTFALGRPLCLPVTLFPATKGSRSELKSDA